MDYETLSNCTILHAEHYKDSSISYTFVIHALRNDYKELMEFLDRNIELDEYHISFNGLNFDGQITQFILNNRSRHSIMDPILIAEEIYKEAQEIITSQNFSEHGSYRNIPEWKLSIKQIDVFRLNHFDNPARRSSLKWIQYSMDWKNMQEMPIYHYTTIKTLDQINTINSYCFNDVGSTKELYNRSRSLLEVRIKVKEDYNLNCYSYSNTKLGSELLLKLYCDKTGNKPWDIRKMGTERKEIIVSDILFSYIKFKSMEFIGFHDMLKTKTIVNTKGDFKYSVKFRGYKFDYGTGGLHQCIKSGIYKTDDEYIIEDADVQGFYPNLAISNGMYPSHLGKEFYEVYKNDIVGVRAIEKAKGKDGNKAIIEGFKEASNATYGNSNSEHSWLYDPQYTMQTTINGQLLLTMLAEELLLSLDNCQLLQINTDGMTFRLKKKDLDKYNNICKNWEELTKLKLEYAEYSAMFIRDVNNYIGVYTNGKTKCKGTFEFENLPLYKNKSFLIIPKAIFNFFVNNISPEIYLMNNRNIFDYCGGVKSNKGWELVETCVTNKEIHKRVLSKIVRYYITNSGCKIIKHNTQDDREIQIEAGEWLQQEFNQYIDKPWEEYDINDQYYLDKIYKEIAAISPEPTTQLKLEF